MAPAYVPSSTAAPANLLVNGGAEASPGSTGHAPPVPLPSWSVTGGMTALRYGAGGGPTASTQGPADRGRVLLSGGTARTATATQTVSTAHLAGRIDRGTATYELSGWLGGYGAQADRAEVVATFRDRDGASLASARIGPVTAADRGGVTALLRRATAGRVPASTRSVRVVVTATRAGGTNDDGYADGLRLVLR